MIRKTLFILTVATLTVTVFTGCTKKTREVPAQVGEESQDTLENQNPSESDISQNQEESENDEEIHDHADDDGSFSVRKEEIVASANEVKTAEDTEKAEKFKKNKTAKKVKKVPDKNDAGDITKELLSYTWKDSLGNSYEFSGAEDAMYITPADGERVMGSWSIGGTFDGLTGVTIQCPELDVDINGVVSDFDEENTTIYIKDTNTDEIFELEAVV